MTLPRVSPKAAALLTLLLLTPAAHAQKADGSHDGATHHCAAHAKEKARSPDVVPTSEVRLVDAELLDQDGARVRFKSQVLADDIVVMDFVFTTCTTVCPVLSAVFARVQGQLGERLGKDVTLVSVSVDPTRDTPARLKAYSSSQRAKAGWRWLTGSQENVREVLVGLGAYTPNAVNHAPMVLVGDARTGSWTRFNGFPSEEQLLAKVNELTLARQRSTSARTERP